MSDASKVERRLQLGVEFLKLELSLFWQRSLFFWGFSAASFVGFGALFREPDKEFAVAIACFGFVCSIAWTLANRGSRYWSSFWRQRVEDIEGDVLGGSLFRVDDVIVPQRGFWGSRSYSVTRLTMALSDFSVLIWMTLATKAAHASGWSVYSMLFLVTAVAYAVVMILKTSVDRNKPTKR